MWVFEEQSFREFYFLLYLFHSRRFLKKLITLYRDIVGRTLFNAPLDPTDKEDKLHAELFQGRPSQSLAAAHEIDPWLSAHIADVMVPLGLLDNEVDDESVECH